jgi:hypothetical protein
LCGCVVVWLCGCVVVCVLCVGLCPYRLLVLLLLIYCYFLFAVVVVVVPMLLSSMLRNVALMISALKQNSLPYTPHLIKRALENTAKAIPNMTIHDIGHGLIQTYDAYTWITKFGRPDMNLWTTPTHMQYQVYRRTPGGMARGVYLRDAADLARPLVTKIGVKPSWREVGNSIGGHTKRDRVRNMFVLFYVRFIFVLYSFCLRFVFVLSSFCLRFVFVLSSFCLRFVFVLSSFCLRFVFVLSSLCFDFIFLFKHRSHLGTCFSSFFSFFFILFHPFSSFSSS